MKRIVPLFVALVLLMAVNLPVHANCRFNGYSYPTGTVVGDRVCAPDGTWQRRE